MTAYAFGRQLEWDVREWFRSRDMWTMRAAQSKGTVDVIALGPGAVYLVQCKASKTGDNRLSQLIGPSGRRDLLGVATLHGQAVPLVAYWHKDGRAARQVRFYCLTGTGPKDFYEWVK